MIFGDMTVSILGCGWYGFELAKALIKKGITVKGSTTSAEKLAQLANSGVAPYLIDLSPVNEIIDPDFFVCDILWISIPPRVRAGKGKEYLSKLEQVITLVNLHQVKQVVLISSSGVYDDVNAEVNEYDAPKPDSEPGKILLAAEELLKAQSSFTTTIIRFSGLIGPGRDPGRFFAGKTEIPNGGAPVNLIHLTDCIGLSATLLDTQAFGNIYHGVSPNHPTRSAFYTRAAAVAGLVPPQFADEKKSWKIISSLNVPQFLAYQYQVLL